MCDKKSGQQSEIRQNLPEIRGQTYSHNRYRGFLLKETSFFPVVVVFSTPGGQCAITPQQQPCSDFWEVVLLCCCSCCCCCDLGPRWRLKLIETKEDNAFGPSKTTAVILPVYYANGRLICYFLTSSEAIKMGNLENEVKDESRSTPLFLSHHASGWQPLTCQQTIFWLGAQWTHCWYKQSKLNGRRWWIKPAALTHKLLSSLPTEEKQNGDRFPD